MTAIKKLKNKTTTSSISPLIAVIIIVVITKHQSFISLKLVFDSIPLFKMVRTRKKKLIAALCFLSKVEQTFPTT